MRGAAAKNRACSPANGATDVLECVGELNHSAMAALRSTDGPLAPPVRSCPAPKSVLDMHGLFGACNLAYVIAMLVRMRRLRHRAGDWDCLVCGNVVFMRKTVCFKCFTPKVCDNVCVSCFSTPCWWWHPLTRLPKWSNWHDRSCSASD